MLFLGSLSDSQLPDTTAMRLMQFTQLAPVREALAAKEANSAVRRLVSAWILQCPSSSEGIVQLRLGIMLQYELSECLPLALEVARAGPKYLTARPQQQALAIVAIGRFGSADNVADLEPLLEDRVPLYSKQQLQLMGPVAEGGTVQVRDVALAVLLHLTDQEPIAYGFLNARKQPQTLFDLRSLSMASDERRAAAAEQWRTWQAQHKPDVRQAASS